MHEGFRGCAGTKTISKVNRKKELMLKHDVAMRAQGYLSDKVWQKN
jgi:hypothetical protein